MKDTKKIHEEILAKFAEYADNTVFAPGQRIPDIPEIMEQMRAIAQQHIDMLYADGHIDKKPEVIVKWNPDEGCVDTYLSWPMTYTAFNFNYYLHDDPERQEVSK